jgi:hypothetical protein
MRHRRSGFARALAAFALLAMAMRALLPAGYMVAPAHDGRLVAITLCSGHGPVDAFIDLNTGAVLDGGEAPDEGPENAPGPDAPCVFATLAQLSAPETEGAPAVVARWTLAVQPPRIEQASARGLAAPPPWATGPPATA